MRSPGFRLAPPQLCATRLIASVAPRTKTISSGAAAPMNARHPPPRRLERQRHLGRALIDAAMDGRIGLAIAALDRVDHRLRLLRGRGAVEIGPALRDRREVGDLVERAGVESATSHRVPRRPACPRPRRRPRAPSPRRSASSASATKARVSSAAGLVGRDAAAGEVEERARGRARRPSRRARI